MHDEHGFNWIDQISFLKSFPNHVVMVILIGAGLILASTVARLQLKQAMKSKEGGIVPEPKLTYRNFFEIVAESLYKLVESVIGHHDAPRYFPLIGCLFTFILTCNLMGLIPGFAPPTANLNTTLALGIFVFLYYNYQGFRAHGIGYVKHFLGPVWYMAPLLFFIELASHVFRPFSLGLRLRGNIMGDHIVVGVFSGMVPYLLPVIFYGLGLFVAFIQAFVFCLLTMVYISLSTAHDH